MKRASKPFSHPRFFLVSYDGLALTSKGVSSGDFQIVKLAIKMRRNASVRGT